MNHFKFNVLPLDDKVFQINNQFYCVARESQPTILNDLIIPINESKFDNIFVNVKNMKNIQVIHNLQDKILIVNHSYLGNLFKDKDVLSAVCVKASNYIDIFVAKPDCIHLYNYDLNEKIQHLGTFDFDKSCRNPRKGYSVANLHGAGVIKSDEGLYLWVPDAPDINNHSFIPIKGTKVLKSCYRKSRQEKGIIESTVILTDAGIYHLMEGCHKGKLSSMFKEDLKKDPNFLKFIPPTGQKFLFAFYHRSTPVDPKDIASIKLTSLGNIFLLTNKKEVYVIGGNGYYQCGVSKKHDTFTWNKIKYPEPIKQIETVYNIPGLFALSENGNLYYHGYNEGSYYPITNRKSNVSKPLKIMEGVDGIIGDTNIVFQNNIPVRLLNAPSKKCVVFAKDIFNNVYSRLRYTKSFIHRLISLSCQQ